MDIVKNLICLENDRASVIRFMTDKLEFVRKDGEVDFPISIEFWDWWKRVASYIDGDPVDICFVYDKNYDLLKENDIIKNNIINSPKSRWKIEHIKSYFWELKPTYLNLVIVGPKQQEYPLNASHDTVSRRFQTNLNFRTFNSSLDTIEGGMDNDGDSQMREDDYTEFAKFFVDLIRREREQ